MTISPPDTAARGLTRRRSRLLLAATASAVVLLSGLASTPAPAGAMPTEVALDATNGGTAMQTLLSADASTSYTMVAESRRVIIKTVDVATGSATASISLNIPNGKDMALSNTGDAVYVASRVAGGALHKVMLSDGSSSLVTDEVFGGFAVVLSADGALGYVAGYNSVFIVDLVAGGIAMEIPVGGNIGAIALSPDGRRIFVGRDGGLEIFDTGTGALETTAPLLGVPRSMALSSDGSTLFVNSTKSGLDRYVVTPGRAAPVGASRFPDFSNDIVADAVGRVYVADARSANIYRFGTDAEASPGLLDTEQARGAAHIAVSADGRLIVGAATSGNSITISRPTVAELGGAALSGARAGQDSPATLLATGTKPISYAAGTCAADTQAGGLPDGLALAADGKITGIPTSPGAYTFTVAATNLEGCSEATFTMDIALAYVHRVSIDIAADSPLARPNDTITWTVTASNTGDYAASFDVVGAIGAGQEQLTGVDASTTTATTVIWEGQSLEPAESREYRFTTVVAEDAAAPLTARATFANLDPQFEVSTAAGRCEPGASCAEADFIANPGPHASAAKAGGALASTGSPIFAPLAAAAALFFAAAATLFIAAVRRRRQAAATQQ